MGAQARRRKIAFFSFIPCVVIPVLLSIVYFGWIAADRYAVEAKFSIRSSSGPAPSDLVGLVSGVSSSGTTDVDSYIVADFIESRDLLDRLEARIDMRAMFDTDKADFLYRFDRTKPSEDFVKYLSRMVSVYYDLGSQIITVEAQAFTPEDAHLLATEIVNLSGNLVNELSEQSRSDTVGRAEEEVARAEELLRKDRAALAQYRESQQEVDPAQSVAAQQQLLGGIEGQLLGKKSERATLLEFLREDAPQIKILDSQIAALEAQVEEQRALFGTGRSSSTVDLESLTSRVGTFEELSVDLEFRQQAYITALASLEAARIEADRQQRYLALFVRPLMPQKAVYPQRALNIGLFTIFALMGWGIIFMLIFVFREHTV
ncbi:MAG: hypothetical protein AAF429_07730 [Pseudomonadota bacterium]